MAMRRLAAMVAVAVLSMLTPRSLAQTGCSQFNQDFGGSYVDHYGYEQHIADG